MKRGGFIALVLIANLVLLSTLLQHIRILGVIPNTTMILVVSYALLRGSVGGAVVGLAAGLLQDVFFGSSIGYYALFYMVAGYISGKSHKNFYRENYLLPMLLSAAFTALFGVAVYVTSFLFRGRYNPFPYLIGTILPETVYTAVLSLVFYRLLFALNDFLERGEAHKRKLF